MQEHQTIIKNLASLFQEATLHTISPSNRLYRGCWQQDLAFTGCMWFSDKPDDAAEYIAMHAQAGRDLGYSPILFEATPVNSIVLTELKGNHIQLFQTAYGGPWSHASLAHDLPVALELLNRGSIHGFLRPGRNEFCILDVGGTLNLCAVTSGKAALKIASGVKGYEV